MKKQAFPRIIRSYEPDPARCLAALRVILGLPPEPVPPALPAPLPEREKVAR